MKSSHSNKAVFSKTFPQGVWLSFNNKPHPPFPFFRVQQVHGPEVLVANEANNGQEADGLVGNYRQSLAIVTADCLPILFLGGKRYALVHAGWRGLKQEIIGHSTIRDIAPQNVFIGPAIQWQQYPVGPEFRNFFPGSTLLKQEGQHYLNLSGEASSQINRTYPNAQITVCPLCTFSTPFFHSFRRDQTPKRNWHLFLPHSQWKRYNDS